MSKYFLLIILMLMCSVTSVSAQSQTQEAPNPRTAFLKSLAVPGWGHYYVNSDDWTRGKYHLGTDVVLLLSFFGLNIHSNNIKQNWFGYTRSTAGIDIRGRNRTLQLAVGDFSNLEAYNDFQERARNWDQFIEDVPENRWNWQSGSDRERYNDLRNRFQNIDQQLPALIGLMVLNRVVSAISAYNRAGKVAPSGNGAALYFSRYSEGSGVLANVKLHF